MRSSINDFQAPGATQMRNNLSPSQFSQTHATTCDQRVLRRRNFRMKFAFLALGFCSLGLSPLFAEKPESAFDVFKNVQPNDDAAVANASRAARELAKRSDLKTIEVLQAMRGSSLIGKNWLSGIANATQRKNPASKVELESFLKDTTQDPEARYTVFRWLTEGDADSRNRWLDSMLNDPSPELRYEAVAKALEPKELPEDQLKTLLDVARQPEQVVELIARLDKLGVKVNQSKHFGFLSTWKFIGPFDNTGSKSYDKVYPVETDWVSNKLADTYQGRPGEVKWIAETSEDPEGAIDLAKLYNNEKGCIVYGVTEIEVPSNVKCELRVGCINAQKVWVNGELAIGNEVYHTGMQVDQYIAPIELKAGTNRILIKVCQNEQKDAWAQRYVFQARICDSTGKAIAYTVKP